MKKEIFLECGCCGQYHPQGFTGDCRDDSNRYTFDEVMDDTIIALEEQKKDD